MRTHEAAHWLLTFSQHASCAALPAAGPGATFRFVMGRHKTKEQADLSVHRGWQRLRINASNAAWLTVSQRHFRLSRIGEYVHTALGTVSYSYTPT